MKDFWSEELESRKKLRKRKLALIIIILIVLIAIITMTVLYFNNRQFTNWCDKYILRKEIGEEKAKVIDLDGDENVQVYAFDKYICIYRKKSLEFYNRVGNQVEKIDLDINNALFTSAGKYMVIYEKEGHKFYLICGKEKLFENSIDGIISQINVSKSGYISVVTYNSSYKSIVNIYNTTGKEIFKTNLVSSRVIDISISQNGEYMAIAEIDMSGILIKSSIQIVSMELAQTKPLEAILYKYEAPTDKLLLNIEYQDKNRLICMYNDSIELLENKESKKIVDLKDKNLSFATIELNNRISLLEEISTGEYTSDTKVKMINPNNSKQYEYITNDIAKSIKTCENNIAVNFGGELHILNINGILQKKFVTKTEINDIVMADNLVGVIYRDKIEIINL